MLLSTIAFALDYLLMAAPPTLAWLFAFLLAALLAACALVIVLFGVVRRLKPAGESG